MQAFVFIVAIDPLPHLIISWLSLIRIFFRQTNISTMHSLYVKLQTVIELSWQWIRFPQLAFGGDEINKIEKKSHSINYWQTWSNFWAVPSFWQFKNGLNLNFFLIFSWRNFFNKKTPSRFAGSLNQKTFKE